MLESVVWGVVAEWAGVEEWQECGDDGQNV